MIANALFTHEDRDTLASELSREARDIRRRPPGNVPMKVKDHIDRIVLHCQETGQVELGMCYVLASAAIRQSGPELVLSVLMDLVVAAGEVAGNPGRN